MKFKSNMVYLFLIRNALIHVQDEGRARGATCIRSEELSLFFRDNGAAGLLTVVRPLQRRPALKGRRVGKCLVCLPLRTNQRLSEGITGHLFPGGLDCCDYTFPKWSVKQRRVEHGILDNQIPSRMILKNGRPNWAVRDEKPMQCRSFSIDSFMDY
jgi:hypothetical protein